MCYMLLANSYLHNHFGPWYTPCGSGPVLISAGHMVQGPSLFSRGTDLGWLIALLDDPTDEGVWFVMSYDSLLIVGFSPILLRFLKKTLKSWINNYGCWSLVHDCPDCCMYSISACPLWSTISMAFRDHDPHDIDLHEPAPVTIVAPMSTSKSCHYCNHRHVCEMIINQQ